MSTATVEYTAEGRLSTKEKRAEACRKTASSFPDSYSYNSPKEELCEEYVQSFLQQFTTYYPKRRVPFIMPENEVGVKKLVCTTLRPTQLPVQEIYDLHECASFLSGYILYEPLQPATEFPTKLFSPTQTLNSHTGDAFDLSTLLCSFLLAANYDAYVVCGYSTRSITTRDQSLNLCPLIQTSAEKESTNKASQKTVVDMSTEEPATSAYLAPTDPRLDSQYIKDEMESERMSKIDTFQLWVPETIDEYVVERRARDEEEAQNPRRRRAHAWVLVLAGRRDVKEHCFVEPSTGRVYSVASNPYIAIESVWNSVNYWVNLGVDKKVSDIDFDLRNQACWENLFVQKSGDEGEGEAKEGSEPEEVPGDVREFDCPVSWVAPLHLDRSRYLLKYPPSGKRTVNYFCAKADLFARGTHPQSMVMRISLYLDKDCLRISEIHEWYEARKDKLYKRTRSYLGVRKHVEYYQPGSIGEVKQWTEYPGKSTEIDFYVDGRLDRLERREEVLGKKIVERFRGRTDLLVFRATQLAVDKAVAGGRHFVIPGGTLAPELFVLKMTQRFARDPSVEPGTDIARRDFFVREGKYIEQYHFGQGQITGRVRTYLHTRAPSIQGASNQTLSQEIGLVEDNDALQEAATLERDCYTNVKAALGAFEQVQEQRERFELVGLGTERNVFEVALNKAHGITPLESAQSKVGVVYASSPAKAATKDAAEDRGRAADYLFRFLRNAADPSNVTKEEALEARQACLDALKSRLVERANIIQARLSDENSKLGRKQEQFQRSQRDGDLSTEEYEKYCTEAMFRIQILEQRLAVHEETALRKFAELDAKLSSDPRLMRALKL